MSENIYNILGIDLSRLKRDYVKNPLHKIKVVRAHNGTQVFETPCKEDLEYLINECYLSTYTIGKLMGKSEKLITFDIRNYGIERSLTITKLMKEKSKTIPNEYRYKSSNGRVNEKNHRQEKAIRKKNEKILAKFNITEDIYKELNIDKSRLKRDYIKNPLLHIIRNDNTWIGREYPEKEDFEYLYIELNLLREDIAKFFNMEISYIKRIAKEFGLKKTKPAVSKCQRKKRTIIVKKYNFPKITEYPDNPEYDIYRKYKIDPNRLSRDYIKYPHIYLEEMNIEELKYVYLECNVDAKDLGKIFGCKYTTPLKYLYKAGIFKPKYKVASKLKVSDYAIGKRNTTSEQDRYELEYLKTHTQDEYDKMLEESYNILKNKEKFKDIIDNADCLYDVIKKLNISATTIIKHINKYKIPTSWTSTSVSNSERKIRDLLPYGKYNFRFNHHEIDIYYPDKKFGIEYNGSFWHADTNKEIDYHYNKSKFFKEYGIFIYHIFENEDRKNSIDKVISNIKYYLEDWDWFYNDDTQTIKVLTKSETNIFLKENCLYPDNNYDMGIGLYSDDEIHQVMTFKKEEDVWRIIQNVYQLNTIVFFGCEKIFNYFKDLYNTDYVFTYIDNSKDNGEWVRDLGFSYISEIEPYYFWNKGCVLFKGYDQKIIKKYRTKLNDFTTPEEEFFRNNGFLKIYDCGYDVYIWSKKELN